jgi:uncharacterized repeat protein (TIGR01451 family)
MKKLFYSILVVALALVIVLPATPVLACHPLISIDKTTLGCDGNYGDGVYVTAGSTVKWKYEVTNIGENNSYLTSVTVSDNMGVIPTYNSGDDGDDKLEKGETWIYFATGPAISGDYSNTGTATGRYDGSTYKDTDDSSYFGGAPGISILKYTNGQHFTESPGLSIAVGAPVTWTYTVTNKGNVPLSTVTVTDNVAGVTPAYVSGDTNTNNKLDLTETWIFTASGTAVAGQYHNTGTVVGTSPTCVSVTASDDSWYDPPLTPPPDPDPEVGGDIYPINKVAMLTPAIILAIALLSASGIFIWRQQAQR